MKDMLSQAAAANPRLAQFISYALCGGMGVLLDLGVYGSLVHSGVAYQEANVAGYCMGTLLSFALNRALTFKVMDRVVHRMALFFGTAAVGYGVSAFALWILVEHLGLGPLLAKIATLGVVLIVQFSLNRAMTFRVRHDEPSA